MLIKMMEQNWKDMKKLIIFVLEDDNEVMETACNKGSDLDKDNQKLNKLLIARHNKLIDKVEQDKPLTKKDLELISDANQIFVNDIINLTGFHQKSLRLKRWLDEKEKGLK